MCSLGSRRIAVDMNPFFNLSDSPSSSGESKDDKVFGNTVPFDETIKNGDIFETQVVDYADDYDDNTEAVDFYEETQIMDLAGETQIMDLAGETQIMDLAGETQILDDYGDFVDDTQLFIVSDSETEFGIDAEGGGGTQVLDYVDLNDTRIPDVINYQTDGGENINSPCRQDDGCARAESLPSDVTQCSDSLRKGFTSVRTASIRATGLAARKMASKAAENGSSLNIFSSGSSKYNYVNKNGTCTIGGVDMKTDMAGHDENGLGNDNNSNIRPLARKLFMEEDLAEEQSNKELDLRMTEFSQLPACDNDLAGLSYVDSQEPGELSQANALQFVDRFLKVNLLEPVEVVIHKNAVCETVTPGLLNKGANSIAREANRRSGVASASIYEWDDKLEDEGGGEFFVKKRDLLFGNRQVSRKSCNKTRTPRHFKAKESQFPERITSDDQQNIQDTNRGFFHSDSKLLNGRKGSKFAEINMLKKHESFTDQQSHLDACDRLASGAPPNAESAEMLDVGFDTQMAAEAMEALSTAPVNNGSSRADEGPSNVVNRSDRQKARNVSKKLSSALRKAYISNSVIVTRSQRKSGVENKQSLSLRPRSLHPVEDLGVDLVNPRVTQSSSSAKNPSGDQKKDPSDRGLQNIDCMVAEINVEGDLLISESVAAKRQTLRKKGSPLTSVEKNTHLVGLTRLNGAYAMDDSRERRHFVKGVHTKKRKTRNDMVSENPNAGVETVSQSIAGGNCMLDQSCDKGRDLAQICDEDTGSAKNSDTVTGACEIAFGSFTRRTRSKRSPQSVQCLGGKKGLHHRAILSTKNVSKLSAEKPVKCSSPAKGTLPDVSSGVHESSCPTDTTPNNLKTRKNVVSPICIGDEYHTPSCKKNLFLKKECYKLTDSEDIYSSPFRVLRQRRDVNNVRVLFSQHLDGDIVKQQKKILSRLGFYEASSILEATHFVADTFTRTRNMLEAIANAKLVVTHLWLESCGQSNCFIDEKNHILRDAKKEKELGFSMPMSLACASRNPILEGKRVLLTQNIKPSKYVITGLVKAVHGQAIGRLCRSTSNNEKLLDDLLVLSCEDDFDVCSPLLEKGIAVYSSELLLNGIITQRLEYERHRLFASHLKKTRSTLWLKKEGDKILRLPKTN